MSWKQRNGDKNTANGTVQNRIKRRDLKCSVCPPHKSENSTFKKDRSWKKSRKKKYRRIKKV